MVLRLLFILFSVTGWIAELYPKDVAGCIFYIFLFRVGLFTLMYMACLMALAILCLSLPMILKVSTDVWPVLFWCSKIGGGTFKCS